MRLTNLICCEGGQKRNSQPFTVRVLANFVVFNAPINVKPGGREGGGGHRWGF